MSLGVLNNIAAIYAQNNLNQTQSSLQKTLTQLSSGSRINSGADDAAGLAVADGLHANEAALTQSSQNASDGIGMLQTADGALSQVTNLLNRAVTLATETANGTFNSSQTSSANQEYQNILGEINNIGSTTNFNGKSVFSGLGETVFVSDGTVAGSTSFSENVGLLSTTSVGQTQGTAGTAASTQTLTSTNATSTTATTSVPSAVKLTFGGANDTISGTFAVAPSSGGTVITTTFNAGTTLSQAVDQLNQQYTSVGTSLRASLSADGKSISVTGDVSTGTNNAVSFDSSTSLTDNTPATAGTPGAGQSFTGSAATLTASSAQTVLAAVTSAIEDVAYQRGVIGAGVNQLTAASNVASVESENLTSAESNIRSTDYGQATSDLAKYQVLSQTGISALAQANSVQQEVLKLLQS